MTLLVQLLSLLLFRERTERREREGHIHRVFIFQSRWLYWGSRGEGGEGGGGGGVTSQEYEERRSVWLAPFLPAFPYIFFSFSEFPGYISRVHHFG